MSSEGVFQIGVVVGIVGALLVFVADIRVGAEILFLPGILLASGGFAVMLVGTLMGSRICRRPPSDPQN